MLSLSQVENSGAVLKGPQSNLFPFSILCLSSAIVYLFLAGAFGEAPPRESFGIWAGAYTFLSMNMLLAFRMAETRQLIKVGIIFGMLFRLTLLFSTPVLSDDYYRFLFDGQMTISGINPYLHLPSAVDFDSQSFAFREGLEEILFANLNSKDYFSVYPPILQLIFAATAKVSAGDYGLALVLLKTVIWLAELGSVLLLYYLLSGKISWPGKEKAVLLYAMNPLPIIECSGSMHFEGLMLFFCLWTIALLHQNKALLAGIVFGLAIGVKLLPAMLLPLFISRLGWIRGSLAIVAAVAMAAAPFAIFWHTQFLENFSTSLRLYFNNFEFNGSIYYALRSLLWVEGEAHPIHRLSLWLKPISAALILLVALLRWPRKEYGWAIAACFMLCTYQFFSTTVHPWYLVPIVGLSVLGRFRFPLLWGFLIFGTYMNYSAETYDEKIWWVIVEYTAVVAFLLYELFAGSQLQRGIKRRQVKARARIKLQRIKPWLDQKGSLLDIGTGNGGVAFALQRDGHDVKTVDVVEKSIFPSVNPTRYDGAKIPFDDQAFDRTSLLTVLHHCEQPEQVLREAVRVAKSEVLLIEDTYTSNWQKQLTFWMDSLVNWEFRGHPHTNKTEAEWEALFQQLDLEIVQKRKDRVLVLFEQLSWLLRKRSKAE